MSRGPWVALALAGSIACGGPSAPADPPPGPVNAGTELPGEAAAPAADPPAPPEPAPPAATPEPPLPPVLALDTHVDTPQRMLDDGDDIAARLADGHLDLPRMREGGLTGAFFSVWVDPGEYPGDAAWQRALALAHAIRAIAERHPDQAMLCTSAEDVRRAAAEGKAAILIGVEGAHALGTGNVALALRRLRELHQLGARYMTVTWSNDNPFGHSSTGARPELGLTPAGRRLVREMNRLGIIVDVSHVSDRTFWDIMDVTTKPVLASHSSARAIADHPRNMDDAMIRRVGEGGGAVCVNYFTQYIDAEYRARRQRLERAHAGRFAANAQEHVRWLDRAAADTRLVRELDPQIPIPTLGKVADHIAHIVQIGGPTAACLGSDFDGVPELPVGLEDVSRLPALHRELRARGLDVEPIFGGNVLRVLEAQSR